MLGCGVGCNGVWRCVCVCVIMSSPLWVPTSANYEATSGLADK